MNEFYFSFLLENDDDISIKHLELGLKTCKYACLALSQMYAENCENTPDFQYTFQLIKMFNNVLTKLINLSLKYQLNEYFDYLTQVMIPELIKFLLYTIFSYFVIRS